MEDGKFYSMLFRMKNIRRWGLMSGRSEENLSEHSFDTAVIVHALALIGNELLGKNYDVNRLAVAALYHDMTEVLTGDLPTPVKYFNEEIKDAYKKVEKAAENKMVSMIPESLRERYKEAMALPAEEKIIMKAADRLSAYIKCSFEVRNGNYEFSSAEKEIGFWIENSDCEELKYFKEHYLNSIFETVDEATTL